MASLILITTFVVCLGMAAAAILVAYQFTTTYRTGFQRHYFYYLVAFYLFAVYGLWGQILGRTLLTTLEVSSGLVETLASFVSVLGVPILFLSWLMLINMASAMAGSAVRQGWITMHAVVFVLLLLGAWLALAAGSRGAGPVGMRLGTTVVLAMLALESMYFAAFLYIAARPRVAGSEQRWRLQRRFALLLAGAFGLRAVCLPLGLDYPWAVLTVLVYFGSNLVPLFYLRATADRLFEPIGAETASPETMDRLLADCRITKRERQIVEEICSGKTNQQIADALFISLQTVKDHTHRIYSKVGVRNRIQLVQKVGG